MILTSEQGTNAVLQAHAELRSAESLQALASCFLRQGQPKKAYSILHGNDVTPETRYLLAIACIKLEKPHEAEEALLPERTTRDAGPTGSFEKLIREVPEGAAGLYLLGVACQRLHRPDHAAEYFKLSLRQDPLMWVAYEALCTLGVVVDADDIFSDGGPDKVADATQYQATPTTARRNIFPADDDDSLPTATPFARRNKPGGLNAAKIDDSAALSSCFEAVGVDSPATTLVKPGPAAKALTFTGVDERTVKRPPSKVARRDAVDGNGRGGDTRAQEHTVLMQKLLRVLKKLGAARQAIAQKRCREALKWLHAVPPRHFETGYVLHAVGRANFESADYDAAVDAFRRMERAEPHRMNGLELLSTALWHLKDEVELCYLARRCVEFDPRSPETWCTAGNCLSLQKEHDAAIRCFHRAIAVDPRFAYAYTLCGHEYVANEDFEKAVAMYRNAMRIDDRHYNAWYGLGAIYYRQEKYELAEYHFERALNLNPQSSVLHCYLVTICTSRAGMTLHANRKYDSALDHLQRAANMEPENPQARFQCANVLISMDRYDEALAELKMVSDHAPREASVHFLMGKVCKKLGRISDAMMHLTFALDLEPKDNNLIKSAIDRLEEPDISEDEKF